MDLDSDLLEAEAPHYTQRRPVICGSFNVSRASIPFFQATVALEDAVRDLELVEKLPSDLRAKWRLEELFQREIDWRRVNDEIVDGYLRAPEKLQFFNAITVCLLPLDAHGMIAGEYGAAAPLNDIPDKFKREPWQLQQLGGVELIRASGSPHGFLRWAPKRVFPATIDGQHRLAALRALTERGNLTQRNLATSIPVIFLILDKRAGFEMDHRAYEDQNPILGVVREVFIDLNKTATVVNRARRILLDDQEIESRCVRAFIAARVGERVSDRLPLGLVHWQHKVTAKFNAGDQTAPFVTTVELLHAIFREILNIRSPRDPNDETQIRKFAESVEDALGVSDVIARNPTKYPELPPLLSYIEQHYLRDGFEQPLANLPAPYLRACVDGFVQRWSTPLLAVLTRFQPYAEFIKQVDLRGGIDGEISSYMCLPRRAQQQQVKDWGQERAERLDRPLRELHEMKLGDWAFYGVFQKGLLVATATAWRHWSVIEPTLSTDQDAFISKWLKFLDTMWNRGVFALTATIGEGPGAMLWSGIGLNPGARTVKWNKVTVDRISGLLLLWWYLHAAGLQKIGSYLKSIEAPRADERYPRAKDAYKKLLIGIASAVRGLEEELSPEEEKRRISQRVRKIIALGLEHSAQKKPTGEDEEEDETEIEDSVVASGALEASQTLTDGDE